MAAEDPPRDDAVQATRKATRVDQAHPRADTTGASDSPAAQKSLAPVAAVALTADVTAGQVRSQAAQLAGHLQRQQATLDHREAELNARLAAMENQIRSARQWMEEREAELTERAAELERREAQLKRREVSATDEQGEAAARRRHEELDRREAELHAVAERLGRRFGSSDELAVDGSLESFRTKLERAEKLLAEQQVDWERKFRELAEQRALFARFMETERAKLAEQRRQADAGLDAQHRALAKQEKDLAARQAAVETLRADVARNQQDLLELRLAGEELWARLTDKLEPAVLTQSLSQIRLKLADEFRLAKDDLAADRAEIKGFAERLAEQYQRVQQQRSDAQSWLRQRTRELEQMAARLATREKQLDEQRSAIELEKTQWQSERFRLEQELRVLLRRGAAPRSNSAA